MASPWRNKLHDKGNPCEKECPDRSSTCHCTCELYLKYRAMKDAENEARLNSFRMGIYGTDAAERAIEASKKRKRGR